MRRYSGQHRTDSSAAGHSWLRSRDSCSPGPCGAPSREALCCSRPPVRAVRWKHSSWSEARKGGLPAGRVSVSAVSLATHVSHCAGGKFKCKALKEGGERSRWHQAGPVALFRGPSFSRMFKVPTHVSANWSVGGRGEGDAAGRGCILCCLMAQCHWWAMTEILSRKWRVCSAAVFMFESSHWLLPRKLKKSETGRHIVLF